MRSRSLGAVSLACVRRGSFDPHGLLGSEGTGPGGRLGLAWKDVVPDDFKQVIVNDRDPKRSYLPNF